MAYLVIMFFVAAVGLGILWFTQVRQRAHLDTVNGFKDSLERLSSGSQGPSNRSAEASRPSRSRHAPAPLDPARREAAKRRLEARRRAAERARQSG